MNQEPLVTIGMPVFNGEGGLKAALESVLAQNYDNWEVVIIDNASEDETPAICRRFTETDPRIHYQRNPTNIGFLPNFRRALELARGKYFTWLAHDDELSDPSYLGTVVGHLEQHPDVVCCHTAFHLLDNELPGSRQKMSFPELSPNRSWPRACRALFRWPHGWLDSVIYGVFRREQLLRVPFPEWTYKGRPHIFCWEMDVLTALSAHGRIVALPQCLRSYRLSQVSVGKQIGESVSSYDLMILGLRMKLILIARARRMPGGKLERLLLIGTVLGNFFRANFSQPYDHRVVLQQRERELVLLQKTAAERQRLIEFLNGEIVARREIVFSKGLAPLPVDPLPPIGEAAEQVECPAATPPPSAGLRDRAADFFRPLSQDQVRRLHDLSEQIGTLRLLCQNQSSEIERLSAEADSWLKLMHSGQ